MTDMDVESQVRRLLAETVGPYAWDTVKADEDLRRHGMNSLNCIRLIVAVEETFGIEIPHERLGIRYAGTIGDICGLIRDIRQGTPPE